MLIWVCALHCEAKPVIDYYRLKKTRGERAFDTYRGEGMVCVISGTGKIASARASAWIAAEYENGIAPIWINLGIAGAARHEIGTAFHIDRVIDADSGQEYYPAPVSQPGLPGSACLTLSQPGHDYREDLVFDMEASGFMQGALRYSPAERTRCIKVVSDNRLQQTGRNRQQVSDLIYLHIGSIDRQAMELLACEFDSEAVRHA